jgi:hypothetical protein
MNISMELPKTAALTHLNPTYFKEALIATLYNVGKLSEKEACLSLNMTRRHFEEMLPLFGLSILADNHDNVNIELNA